MIERCSTCRFWENEEGAVPSVDPHGIPGVLSMPGLCLRYPPFPCPPEGQHGRPVTEWSDWCGEWQEGGY
jgi:hypothetical protein